MKLRSTFFKGFNTSTHALTVVSIVLLAFSSILFFQNLKEASYSSKAFISNTWTVWGDNTNGQFCDGGTTGNSNPAVLQNSGDVIAISGGVDHMLALKNDNTIKSCGFNAKGQLGNGSTTNTTSFVNVTGFPVSTSIVQVVAGDQISFALTSTGVVYQWGDTIVGVLNAPTVITGLSNITSITSSEKTLLAIDNTNTLYAYGVNANGESGNGTYTQVSPPAVIDTSVTQASCSKEACAIIKTGKVYTSGKNSKKELADQLLVKRNTFDVVNKQRFPDLPLSTVTKVASGPSSYNFYALDASGNVWSWGDAGFLGYTLPGNLDSDLAVQISSLNNVTSIAGGYPLAIRSSGGLYTWTNTTPSLISTITSATKLYDSGSLTPYVKGNLFDPFVSSAISTLAVNCSSAEVNQTTTCSFTLPLNKDLPNLFKIGIGSSTPGGNCSSIGTVVTCFNVPTGPNDGTRIIYGQISSNTKVATTSTVTVIPTIVGDVNIALQSGTCTPNPAQQGDTTDCTFPLIGSTAYGLPTNGLRAGITNTSGDSSSIVGPSDPCTITATTLTCNNVPTYQGANLATVATHEVIVYEPTVNYFYNKASVTVEPPTIKDTNISNSGDCVDSVNVQLGNTYNCTFVVTGSPNNFYNLPVGGIVAKTSPSTADSPVCSLLNNGTASALLSCINIPTSGSSRGVQNVLVKAGTAGSYVDKGGLTIFDSLNNVDLATLNITCADSVVNSTSSCSFPLPLFTISPSISISIGDSIPGGTCVTVSTTVNCSSVPTGTGRGQQPIYAQLLNSTKINTGKTAVLTQAFQTSEVPSSSFLCTPTTINTTTTCTFDISTYETLDTSFSIRIGNANPSTSCSLSSQTVTCTGVSTGSDSGNQSISAGNGSFVNTGEFIFLTRPLTSADLTNFAQFTNLSCTPNPVAVFSTTTCTGQLPNYIVYGSTSLKLRVDNQFSVGCGIAGQVFTCTGISSGTVAADKNVDASIDNTTFVPTGLILVVSNKVIGNTEIQNIGVPNTEQVLSEFKCGTNGIVYAGKPTTCTAKINAGWVIFPEFRLGVGVDPAGTCTQSGITLTCINVPVINDINNPGVLFLVNKSGEVGFTEVLFSVQQAPNDFVYTPPTTTPSSTPSTSTPTPTSAPSTTDTNASTSVKDTPRTGGLNTLGMVALTGAWLAIFYKTFLAKKIKVNKK
jgi:alpha-tubulin suppressor-like RCC1 family protein